jgi:hypothetical protein
LGPKIYVHKLVPHLNLATTTWWVFFKSVFSREREMRLMECLRGLIEGCIKAGRLISLQKIIIARQTNTRLLDFELGTYVMDGIAKYGLLSYMTEIKRHFGFDWFREHEAYGLLAADHSNVAFIEHWHYLLVLNRPENILIGLHILRRLMEKGNNDWSPLFNHKNEPTRDFWVRALSLFAPGDVDEYKWPATVPMSVWPWLSDEQKADIKDAGPDQEWPD